MAHGGKGGNKSKPQKAAKHKLHFDKLKRKKYNKENKWKRDRECWANNKEYQQTQEERTKKIANYTPGIKFHLKAENEQSIEEENEQRKRRNKFKRRESALVRNSY